MPIVSGGGSGGGAPFNGGTITNPLDIASAVSGTTALTVGVPTHDGSTSVIEGRDDTATGVFVVSDQGNVTMTGGLSVALNTQLGGVSSGVQVYVFASPTQAAAIMQVFDSGGATPFQLNKDGRVILASHTAPADGDLAAGECSLWFDQTNGVGNTKLMVKGKSADGTVKTASIVLA